MVECDNGSAEVFLVVKGRSSCSAIVNLWLNPHGNDRFFVFLQIVKALVSIQVSFQEMSGLTWKWENLVKMV